MNAILPTASDIDSFKAFPFIDSGVITDLKSELPAYLAAAEDVSEDINVLQWWKNHADRLPKLMVKCL